MVRKDHRVLKVCKDPKGIRARRDHRVQWVLPARKVHKVSLARRGRKDLSA